MGAKIEFNDEFLSCFETCRNFLSMTLPYDFLTFLSLSSYYRSSWFDLSAGLSRGPIGKVIFYQSSNLLRWHLKQHEYNYKSISKQG